MNALICKSYVVSMYHSLVKVFHVIHFYRARITPSTGPDWGGTATKQTDIHLFLIVYLYCKCAINVTNLCTK